MITHKPSLIGIIILCALAGVGALMSALASPTAVARATGVVASHSPQSDLTGSLVTYTPNAASYTSTKPLATSPALVSINPARNAITATLATSITARYDQPMSAGSVTSRTFVIHGMQSGVVTQVHGLADAQTLLVSPNRPFHQGELVYAIATTGTTNITGTSSLSRTQWQFNAGEVVSRCVGGFTSVANLTGLVEGSAAWGDYDADGDLDLLTTGYSMGGYSAQIYRNTGAGFTQVYAGVLPGVAYGNATWGDYDNDGDLDILLAGYTGSSGLTQIYQNTGSGFSQVYAGSLAGGYTRAAWGDYDNDGDLDIVVGEGGRIYQNTGNGFTQVYAGNLANTWYSNVVLGDYDNDGDLDILLTGTTGSSFVAQVYQNTGSGFSLVYPGSLTGAIFGSAAWGDYDHDGDLDILLTGETYGGGRITQIYQNTGVGFSPVYTGSLPNMKNSNAAWGDYDNDGDLDILLTGDTGSGFLTQIYQNTGVGFSPVYTGSLSAWAGGSVAWGDYDGDSDLDILVSGGTPGYGSYFTQVYRNEDCADLSLTKTVTPQLGVSGQAITYTLTFSNAGGWPATGVILTDIIPVSVTNVSMTSSGAAITNTGANPSYVWQVQDRNPGQVGIITLTGVLSGTLPPGVFTNTATIAGAGQETNTANNRAAVSLTHIARVTTTLTSTPNPSTWGQSVTFTASVTSAAGLIPTGNLTLTLDGGSVGPLTLTNGVATYMTTALAAGAHPVKAFYNGDANHAANTSSTYTQTVNRASTIISVTSAPNPSLWGQAIIFTATVTSASGNPTGSITFTIDSAAINVPLGANGQATYLTSTLAVGTHVVSAQYSGDGNFNTSSSPLNGGQTVNDVSIANLTALNSSPTPLTSATFFTATITAGSHVAYQWNFGDGHTGSGANSTHTYAVAGTYTAIVTATNGAGSAAAQTTVYVTTAPIAQAGPDQIVRSGQPVMLNGSASSDPGNFLPLTCHWQQTGGLALTLSGVDSVTATFSAPLITQTQVLTFTLTITNAQQVVSLPDVVVVTVEPYRLMLPVIRK